MSLTRRQLLATGAAAAALPSALRAQTAPATPEPFVLDERFVPQYVNVQRDIEPFQLMVVPQEHFLYWINKPGKAIRYGVGVGRAGLEFQGQAVIGAKKEWPTWRPTDEMIERDPHLYGKFAADEDYVMPGGPGNPLGARALYLFQDGRDTFYRIHGTTEPQSIGRSVSNGCIRMLNAHVAHLYEQVPIGTPVTVY